MPMYTGKTADGSDMEEFAGFDVSPNGKYWGSKPMTVKDEERLDQLMFEAPLTRRERRALTRKHLDF